MAGIRRLLGLAVDPAGQIQRLRVRDLVGGHHAGSHGAGAVGAFSEKELLVTELDVAYGDIVDYGVAENGFQGF